MVRRTRLTRGSLLFCWVFRARYIDLGINQLWPQIGFFDADVTLYDKVKEAGVALYIHPDRQKLIPRGTPAQIETQVRAYCDRFHASNGGGMFYIEMENDAPFENVNALVRSVFKHR